MCEGGFNNKLAHSVVFEQKLSTYCSDQRFSIMKKRSAWLVGPVLLLNKVNLFGDAEI